MQKRPISVIVISCAFIATGVIGLIFRFNEVATQRPFPYEMAFVFLLCFAAIVCGAFMLQGRNWARWLSLAWMAYHVILSGFHSVFEFTVHGLLLAVLAYFLFRPRATEYFRAEGRSS
jgi:hypothetical protein